MRDERAYLADMISSAKRVQKLISGKSLDDFTSDELMQDGVLRHLGIIGEAASRISQATRDAVPTLPWQDIIRMRNLLVHAYFSVSLEIAWDTACKDLAPLIKTIDARLKMLDSGAGNP